MIEAFLMEISKKWTANQDRIKYDGIKISVPISVNIKNSIFE
ncbi:hypothetical protein [Acetivibrio straminisolvens]|nr:hypothetical protein [Acetivibrio straminisolvens]